MSRRVYLAGSSHPEERGRVEAALLTLQAVGVEVISTWLDDVKACNGDGNPRTMAVADRRGLALKDFGQVAQAHIFWLLVPPPSIPTRGAWAELAYAYSLGKQIVCSGDTVQSIFSSLGYETTSDEVALQTVVSLAGMPGEATVVL